MNTSGSTIPRYAGFWRRLLAMLVEMAIWIPISFLTLRWGWSSHIMLIPFSVFGLLLGTSYNFYFMRRWGQTIGKMVAGIRVVTVELAPLGWPHIIKRYSVDFIFGLLTTIATTTALLQVPEVELNQLTFLKMGEKLVEFRPRYLDWVNPMQQIWFWSELVVLLLNKKKRALHDFIAGTVVICK